MTYALKTADNTGLFIHPHSGRPVFLADPPNLQDYWPVDATIPFGHVQTGWTLEDGVCKATSAPQTPSFRERLASRIRARREEVVNDGATVESGGRLFWTDKNSQTDMGNALALLQLTGAPGLLWSGSGWTAEITLSELAAAAVAVGVFVQGSFARRAQLLAELATTAEGDLLAFAQTVEDFWPPE